MSTSVVSLASVVSVTVGAAVKVGNITSVVGVATDVTVGVGGDIPVGIGTAEVGVGQTPLSLLEPASQLECVQLWLASTGVSVPNASTMYQNASKVHQQLHQSASKCIKNATTCIESAPTYTKMH